MELQRQFIPQRKIRIAVIGCGRISKKHLEAIQYHHNDLELVALCDTDQNVLSKHLYQYNVESYSNLTDLLNHCQVDVIALCTPSGIHAAQTIQAANAKVHVITEKPMAVHWQDGLNMVKACDSNEVILFVVKQNRKNATLSRLHKAIIEQRFGKIYQIVVNVFWSRPQEYYDQAAWRGTWENDGGAFMNQASHYVDLLHWLGGPVKTVYANMATFDRKIEVENCGVANLVWESGAIGSINVSMLAYPQNLEGSITLLGEKGCVKIGGVAVNQILHWKFDNKCDEDENIEEVNYQTSCIYGHGHTLYYQNMIEALRGKALPEVNGQEGLKSLEILTAIYRSAKNNEIVNLPLGQY